MPYSSFVVNTGQLTLTAVNVTDVQTAPSLNASLGPISCPQTTLAPGASTTCTATQADLDNGSVAGVAAAHGTPPGATPVNSSPSALTIPTTAPAAHLSIVKSSSTTTITTVDQLVPYSFLVVNTGGVSLTAMNVTDAQTPQSLDAGLGPITRAQTTLAPGAWRRAPPPTPLLRPMWTMTRWPTSRSPKAPHLPHRR